MDGRGARIGVAWFACLAFVASNAAAARAQDHPAWEPEPEPATPTTPAPVAPAPRQHDQTPPIGSAPAPQQPQPYPPQPYPQQPYAGQPYPPPYPPAYPPPGSPTYAVDEATRSGTRSRREVWLSALGLFALSYGIPVLVVATTSNTRDDVFFAPVVGPWMYLADAGGALNGEAIFWIALDGVFQLVGAVGFVVGLASPESMESRRVTRAGRRDAAQRTAGPRLRLNVGPGSFGATIMM